MCHGPWVAWGKHEEKTQCLFLIDLIKKSALCLKRTACGVGTCKHSCIRQVCAGNSTGSYLESACTALKERRLVPIAVNRRKPDREV